MKRYGSYKESGVDWLGLIPTHWDNKRLKQLVKLNPGKTEVTYIPDSTEVSFLPMERVGEDGSIDLSEVRPLSAIQNGYTYCRENDVIVAKITPCFENGKGALCKGLKNNIAFGSTEFIVLRITQYSDARFIYYVTKSDAFMKLGEASMTGAAGQKRISDSFVSNFRLAAPNNEEQKSIARYLDKETARIDQLIANKRQQIKKLNELRQITISRAVTLGLDPTVPMKNSGIDWLGEIPAHWKTRRVRDIAQLLQTGPFGSQLHSDEYVSDGIPVINPSHLIQGRIIPDNKVTIDQQTCERLSRHSIHANDIIFARRGEMGRCALVTKNEAGWLCGTGSLLFRPNTNRSYPAYHSFVLASKGIKEWLKLRSVGSTMDNLNTEILGEIPLPMPPLNEQESIHEFIGKESMRFEKLTNNIKQQIEKLKELRKITINDAVTGKVKVKVTD